MNHYLFIVEGAHDVSLISSILRVLNFKSIKNINNIADPLKNLIIDRIPFQRDTIDFYNNIPSFYNRDNKHICILSANGETNLIKVLNNSISKFRLEELNMLNKIVIFCDADLKNRESKINNIIKSSFPKNNELEISKKALEKGFVQLNDLDYIRVSIEFFVMPNNKDQGRLEQVLLEVISKVDNELLKEADLFLEKIPLRYKHKWSKENSRYDKTRISCVGNVKVPAASMGSLISSSKWITEETVQSCELLAGIYMYIKNILNQ